MRSFSLLNEGLAYWKLAHDYIKYESWPRSFHRLFPTVSHNERDEYPRANVPSTIAKEKWPSRVDLFDPVEIVIKSTFTLSEICNEWNI